MTYIQGPRAEDLPTSRQLARATALAAATAAAILVVAVLPAEYGIDPTGAGRALGLTAMGEMKQQEAATADATPATVVPAATAEVAAAEPAAPVAGVRTEEVRLTLAPNEGTEVKATMRAGEQFDYAWSTDGAEVRFELHGEELNAAADEYTSYEKGASKGGSGTFRAPFDGTHGWYWRNRSGAPVTITVRATGTFSAFAQKA